MRKRFLIFAVFCLLLVLPCGAETLEEQLHTDRLYEALDDESREQLSRMDVDSPTDSLDFSWDRLLQIIPDIIREKYLAPLKVLLASSAVIIIASFLSAYSKESESICQLAGALALCGLFLPGIIALVSDTKAVCDGVSVFLLAAIPVYAALHIAAGSAILGSTYGGVSIVAANFLCQVAGGFVLPSLSIFMGLSVSSAFSHINIKGITESVYKLMKWLMVLSVTVFSGIISIQSAVAGATDVATTKTVKLLASSAIPIVGGAFGEGVAAVQNSIKVLKSGTSAFGIIATLCIFLAPVIQTLLWMLACQLATVMSELFGSGKIKEILGVMLTVLKSILAVLLSLCIISLVTAAITLFFGA